MSKQVEHLIWTQDDVIGAMINDGIEVTDENIERAVNAVEGANMEYAMEIVNEEIFDAVHAEFN